MAEIILKCGAITQIDDQDFEEMSRYQWKLNRDGYPIRKVIRNGKKGGAAIMHRVVTDAQPGQIVDHIDGDKLNNKRSNLRFVSKRENTINSLKRDGFSSKQRGVSKKTNGRWVARIRVNQVNMHLGTFDTEDEAAHAYNKAAIEHFGDFARLNPIGEDKK